MNWKLMANLAAIFLVSLMLVSPSAFAEETKLPTGEQVLKRYVEATGGVDYHAGPTAFVPGSQYWAVDREGLGMGEERLDPP